ARCTTRRCAATKEALPRPRDARRSYESERLRDERRKDQRGGDRRYRSDHLDAASEPIARLPKRPQFHEMCGAAGNDESPKGEEDGMERNLAPRPIDQIGERCRNRDVCGPDKQIGDGMNRKQRTV